MTDREKEELREEIVKLITYELKDIDAIVDYIDKYYQKKPRISRPD